MRLDRWLLFIVLVGGFFGFAITTESRPDSASQSSFVEWNRSLSFPGLPAASLITGEVAVAASEGGLQAPSEIHILRPPDYELIRDFRPLSDLATEISLEQRGEEMDSRVESINAWLKDQQFVPLISIYGPEQFRSASGWGCDLPGLAASSWLVEFDCQSEILTIKDGETGRLRFKLELPWESIFYLAQPDILCAGRGRPRAIWTDESHDLVVIEVYRSYSAGHYCEFASEWRVYQLAEDEPLIDVPEVFEPPLEVWFRDLSVPEPTPIEVGRPFQISADHSPGESVVYRWDLVEQPGDSGTLLFEFGSRAELIADRPGNYEVSLFATSGRHTSRTVRLRMIAEGELKSEATIGSDGGAVGLPDGAALLVPSGSLEQVTSISVAEIPQPDSSSLPEGTAFAGPVYDFLPSNLNFNSAVLIIVPYQRSALGEEEDSSDILLHRVDSSGTYQMVGSSIGSSRFHSQKMDQERGLIRIFTMKL